MKVGVLYICTGNYKIFWKDFYLSSEKFFIPEVDKQYFVFTDDKDLDFIENKNIEIIKQENLGWPGNTLRRYEVFAKVKNKLEDFNYIFFLNANLLFLEEVKAEDFLPNQDEKFTACLHPGYFNKSFKKFTFEKNKKSKAFLENKEKYRYFAGGLNGGKTEDFLKAIGVLEKNIKTDIKNNIIAKWHDESHWNWFINNHLDETKILSPSYLYPEGSNLLFVPKILIRDKRILGGHSRLRNKFSFSLFFNEYKKNIKKLFRKFKPRKIIKIKGGLGNQMFQYAHGRSLEFSGKKVVFDVSFFEDNKNDIARDFKLDNFNIATKAEFINKKNIFLDFFIKLERRFGLNIEEFFQNEKYIKDIEEIIRKEFTLKNNFGNKAGERFRLIENSENSVSLHIRRGDYVSDKKTKDYHGICDLEYYKKAVDYLKKKLGEIKIFVFSDDIDWVKENLQVEDLYFVSNDEIKDYEELILMSKCHHNIIANSTFSWWGAWLNENKDKIVIAPKKWFNNEQANDKNDIVPKNWIKL